MRPYYNRQLIYDEAGSCNRLYHIHELRYAARPLFWERGEVSRSIVSSLSLCLSFSVSISFSVPLAWFFRRLH